MECMFITLRYPDTFMCSSTLQSSIERSQPSPPSLRSDGEKYYTSLLSGQDHSARGCSMLYAFCSVRQATRTPTQNATQIKTLQIDTADTPDKQLGQPTVAASSKVCRHHVGVVVVNAHYVDQIRSLPCSTQHPFSTLTTGITTTTPQPPLKALICRSRHRRWHQEPS